MGIVNSYFVNRIQILDCYTDPLGWKVKLNIEDLSQETSVLSTSCKDVRDLDNLYSSIIELGKGNCFVLSFYVCLVASAKLTFDNWIILMKIKNWVLGFYFCENLSFCCSIGWTRERSFYCCHWFGNSVSHTPERFL